MEELRAEIKREFGSEAKFAYSIGWTRQHLNRILNRQSTPDIKEIASIAHGLSKKIMDIAVIFLDQSSPIIDEAG